MSISSYYQKHFWKINFSFLFIFSVICLTSAFIIDKYLGFDPCILCIYARVPYFVILFLSFIGLIFYTREKVRSIMLQLITLSVIVGAAIAIYHTGVERDWWNPTINCSPTIDMGKDMNLEDFLNQIDKAPIGDCSKPAIRLLGLSLAEINIIINFLLLSILIKLIKINAASNKEDNS